jgi:hypothetical protein
MDILIIMFTAEDFIRKGFFPDSVIPPLCSYTLANAFRKMQDEKFDFGPLQKKSKCCFHSIPKIKNIRRHFYIPNPLHQILLCKTIGDKWNEIDQHIKKSLISISYPTIRKDSKMDRSFDRPFQLNERKYVSAERSFDSRYVLITDISRYFPTIYSHIIPWALYGKEFAKDHKDDKGLLGNQLDICVRNTQDSQTLGIPTGPDTSHIIAEIIGAAIDCKLIELLGGTLKGWRYVDDFNLFFKTRADAENALYALHSVLKYFELEINPNKTDILQLPIPLEQPWVTELRSFEFRKSKLGQKGDIINYFSKAYSFSNQFPDDSVLKYAITRTHKVPIHVDNWELFESLLLKSIISEPSCIPIVTKILYHWNYHGYILTKEKIASVISDLICYHSKFSHSYEISWVLWLAKTLEIKIDDDAKNEISKSEDPIVALIALDLREDGKIKSDLDTQNWMQYMESSELYDTHWLLTYEAFIKKWLPSSDGSDYIANDPFFSKLQRENTQFYDKTIHEVDYYGKFPAIEESY